MSLENAAAGAKLKSQDVNWNYYEVETRNSGFCEVLGMSRFWLATQQKKPFSGRTRTRWGLVGLHFVYQRRKDKG